MQLILNPFHTNIMKLDFFGKSVDSSNAYRQDSPPLKGFPSQKTPCSRRQIVSEIVHPV